MSAKRYGFNGGEFTMAEIRVIVPCYSESALHKHIADGRNTTALVTQYNGAAARRRKPAARSQFTVSRKAAQHQ